MKFYNDINWIIIHFRKRCLINYISMVNLIKELSKLESKPKYCNIKIKRTIYISSHAESVYQVLGAFDSI
jgi:hypothetical protein